jgi:AraC family transcriptional regulator
MQSTDNLMNNAAELIRKLAFQDTNINSIVYDIGLSPVQFSRRFKSAFNIKPSEYLSSLRIKMIQKLLVETDMTIMVIAHDFHIT